jgi:hypothetical protein
MILLVEVHEDNGVTAEDIRRQLLAGPRPDIQLAGFRATIIGEAARRTPGGQARPSARADEFPAVMKQAEEG